MLLTSTTGLCEAGHTLCDFSGDFQTLTRTVSLNLGWKSKKSHNKAAHTVETWPESSQTARLNSETFTKNFGKAKVSNRWYVASHFGYITTPKLCRLASIYGNVHADINVIICKFLKREKEREFRSCSDWTTVECAWWCFSGNFMIGQCCQLQDGH